MAIIEHGLWGGSELTSSRRIVPPMRKMQFDGGKILFELSVHRKYVLVPQKRSISSVQKRSHNTASEMGLLQQS